MMETTPEPKKRLAAASLSLVAVIGLTGCATAVEQSQAKPTPAFSYVPDCSKLPPFQPAGRTSDGRLISVYVPLPECTGQPTKFYPLVQNSDVSHLTPETPYVVNCWAGKDQLDITTTSAHGETRGAVFMGPGVSLMDQDIPYCYAD